MSIWLNDHTSYAVNFGDKTETTIYGFYFFTGVPLFPQKSKKIPLRTYPSVFVQNSAYSHVNDKVESCPRVLCLTNKITNADYFMTQAITAKRIFHKVCESHHLRYILGSSGYNQPRMPVSPFPVSCFR